MLDNLALDGRVDEARAFFERVCGYANDVGLLSEEIDPTSGELVGNYPQGFRHLALIRSALHRHGGAKGAGGKGRGLAERAAEAERSSRD